MTDSWVIYDRLLEEIPSDAVVKACLVGRSWTVVDSEGLGIAMTCRGDPQRSALRPPYSGRRLSELAAYLRSWDLHEASLGMAAVNSHYNSPERVRGWLKGPLDAVHGAGALTDMLEHVSGKKVAVIGHFPDVEAAASRCELTVLERDPHGDDLPDFAAEYVLPEQDYVFITGVTVTNKTLPRLIELSAQATVVLMGPSVPLAPWWFDQGVDVLAGMVVIDRDEAWRYCQEGGLKGPFSNGGRKVQITRDDVRADLSAMQDAAARVIPQPDAGPSAVGHPIAEPFTTAPETTD
ncbi:MAG: DUF364 domain-containing protein [Actinobacteria bacterium]|nr:DUF364 domain-containing protein [Actinomycetota bacterium]